MAKRYIFFYVQPCSIQKRAKVWFLIESLKTVYTGQKPITALRSMYRVEDLSPAMGRGIYSRNRVWHWVAKLRQPYAYLVPSPHSGTKVTDTVFASPPSRISKTANAKWMKTTAILCCLQLCLICIYSIKSPLLAMLAPARGLLTIVTVMIKIMVLHPPHPPPHPPHPPPPPPGWSTRQTVCRHQRRYF